jgi:hypothetical protein
MAINAREKPEDVESQESTSTESPEVAFPEGGRTAWLVVLGCFCVMFFTFGYVNAFGCVAFSRLYALKFRQHCR